MAPNTLSPFSSLFLLSIIFLLATTTIINNNNNNNNNFLVHAKQFSNLKTLTISGFDSGATMATQLQFAHSSKVQGIAIFSGLPYYCIKNNLTRSEKCFKQANTIPVEELLDTIQRLFDYYLIDNPNFISLHKIYLQHGSKDRTITREALEKSKELYEALGVKSEYLKTNFDIPSGHALPSIDYTVTATDKENNKNNNCGEPLRKPYIQNCGVDVVGEALKFLITSLNIKFINETIKDLSADKLKKNLVKIDQRKFKSEYHLMNDFGYLYIPTECQKDETKCNHLHVAFHGCDQLGEEFMVYSGYNRIAELNNIVVFYPMSKPQDIYNPYGCWDFFGTENGDDFRSELYATRIGPQMTTVTLMIEDIGYFMDMKSITERHATEVLIGLALLIIGLIYKFTAPLFKSAPKPKQE